MRAREAVRAVIVASSLSMAPLALAQDDGLVLFLDQYLHGDFYVAALGDIDRADVTMIQPRKLSLPWWFDLYFEIGNADVATDGTTIVFSARSVFDLDWNIYIGAIDLWRSRIHRLRTLVGADGRDEDPRFAWDESRIVYKCSGNICVYPEIHSNPVVVSSCELWAPAFDPTGYEVSYARRCAAATSDRIAWTNLLTGESGEIPSPDGGADRFAQFLDDGRIVYSHIDAASATASLWSHDAASATLLHDRTLSDDDPYPDKHDRNHIAFIGWQDDGYDLFVYRRDRNDSVQLTDGIAVLGPVLFRR
jgi:hypothetical protein